MIGSLPNKTQREGFRPLLTDFIDRDHKLVLLAEAIDWQHFEDAFSKEGIYYGVLEKAYRNTPLSSSQTKRNVRNRRVDATSSTRLQPSNSVMGYPWPRPKPSFETKPGLY